MLRYLVDPANAITTGGLLCSALSLYLAMAGHLELAVGAALWAVLADHLDGIVAGRTKNRDLNIAKMGKSLDGFGDIIYGAVLPAVIIIQLSQASSLSLATGAALLTIATGDLLQWCTMGLGAYAVTSWVQKLRATDRPTYALLWGTPAVRYALLGFACITFVSYSLAFWMPPYAMRTFGLRIDVAGIMIGVPAGFAAALGCVAGGRLSDVWRRGNPRGRIYACMLALALPPSIPDRQLLIAMAFGVVLFTLVVQGVTLRYVIRWAGLSDASHGVA